MGGIADFIIATEREALEYSQTQSGVAASDLLEAKGITRVELSTLLAILDENEWNENLLDLFPDVQQADSLTLVSGRLLSRLTDFDYDLDQVAADWAATEEMQCEDEHARNFIDALAQHALRARRLGKPVYLSNTA